MAEPESQGCHDRRVLLGENKPHTIEAHRINDFLLGHVGQVSYVPVDNDGSDVGILESSRGPEHPPVVRQLIPFEEWFPPARHRLDIPNFDIPNWTTSQHTRSQTAWLLKTHEEAFLGNTVLRKLVSEEIRSARMQEAGMERQVRSVVAVGEITDLSNPSHIRSRPAVAMAAGEAGHVIRVSLMRVERWAWSESCMRIRVGTPQCKFQGCWTSEASPISKLQFATKMKPYDPIRWLIAQRESSTTIFQPETQSTPALDAASGLTPDTMNPQGIIMINPIVTLKTDTTGGDAHSDFSLNMGLEDDVLRLAIIDRSGNWSIWSIERRRGRFGTARAVPKQRGALHRLLPRLWPSKATRSVENGPRVSWASTSTQAEEWEHNDSNRSNAYLAGCETPFLRGDKLLICDGTYLQVLDAERNQVSSYLDFSTRDGRAVLLDAQTFHGSPTHVFALTTEKLYLIDVADAKGQQEGRPAVLLSCPHFMETAWDRLQMSVKGLRVRNRQASALVLLHSNRDVRVLVFFFRISLETGSVSFHHQTLGFPGTRSSNLAGLAGGVASLEAVPLQLYSRRKKDSSVTEPKDDELQHFQLLGLANDLSLSSSMMVMSFGGTGVLSKPVKVADAVWDEGRWTRFLGKKCLQESQDAFVVPDASQDDKPQNIGTPSKRAAKHSKKLQLRYFWARLVGEIDSDLLDEGFSEWTESSHNKPVETVQLAVENRAPDAYMALTTLLGFSDLWHRVGMTEAEAGSGGVKLEQVQRYSGVRLFKCGTFGQGLNVAHLLERLSSQWCCRLPEESVPATQWRYLQLALKRMATEVFYSQIGIYAVPIPTVVDAGSESCWGKIKRQSSAADVSNDASPSPARSDTRSTKFTDMASCSWWSRATSPSTVASSDQQQGKGKGGLEDGAVARLRMYLPSIKFTPAAQQGQSRVISLWPEQRGSDPASYRYEPTRKGCGAEWQAASRRREREEERRRRRAERRARLVVGKVDGASDSHSRVIQSSPVRQIFWDSQEVGPGSKSQVLGDQSQSQSFRFSQAMSQPVAGYFGGRTHPRFKKKTKVRRKTDGFR